MNAKEKNNLLILIAISLCIRITFKENNTHLTGDRDNVLQHLKNSEEGQFEFETKPPFTRLLVYIATKPILNFIRKSNKSSKSSKEKGRNDSEYPMSTKKINDKFFLSILSYINIFYSIISIVMIYEILRGFCNENRALSISLFYIFENAFQSHYSLISYDAYVLFYHIGIFYSIVMYQRTNNNTWLYILGLYFGALISSDHIGFVVIVPVFAWLSIHLFKILADKNIPIIFSRNSGFVKTIHIFIAVVLLPIAIYIITFYIYFKYQNTYNESASSMSIRYQSQLHNNLYEESDRYLVDRSIITLINKENKVYIKSEKKSYKTGSKQQITYSDEIKDEDAIWMVVKIHIEKDVDNISTNEDKFFIKNGDYIKLVHMITDKYLHSHNIDAENHSNKKFKEVSCFGSFKEKITDDNDYWVVKSEDEYIQAKKSEIKLLHVKTGLYLGIKTPPSENYNDRNEVYSSIEGKHTHRIFFAEDNRIDEYYKTTIKDEKIKERVITYEKMTFWSRFFEYNINMISHKNKNRNKKENGLKPYKWPFTYKKASNENKNNIKGNNKEQNNDSYTFKNGLRKNEFNWKIALFIFIFPFFSIFNLTYQIKTRNGIQIPKEIYMAFWFFMSYYAKFLIQNSYESPSNYLVPLHYALIVSLYFISIVGNQILFIMLTISFSCFLNRVNG